MQNLRAILSDPQHPARNILKGLSSLIIGVGNKFAPYTIIISFSALAILFKPKWAHRHRLIIFLVCCLGYLFAMVCCITWKYKWLNSQMIDIAMLGFISWLLLQEKPKRLFYAFYPYGVVYTICNYFGSNTEVQATGMTLSVCGTAGVIFVMLLCRELSKEHETGRSASKWIAVLAAVLVLIQLGAQGYLKATRQYWDEPLSHLNSKISIGAGRGIVTTEDRKEEYEESYQNLKELLIEASVEKENRFFSFSFNPVLYLDAELPNGSFSSWTYGYYNKLFERMEEYIRLGHNPPDVLYCKSEEDLPKQFDDAGYIMYSNGQATLYKAIQGKLA